MNYLYPRLNAQQVTGADDRPLAMEVLDMNKLLSDPAALEAAQTLSIAMSMGTQDPDEIALPPADPHSDTAKNTLGHWEK